MYNSLIKNYIDNLKKEDIIKFISKNNYRVNDKEIETIYFYIKNYWIDFLENKNEVWEKLSQDISKSTYIEIQNLYQKYKKYI